MDAKPHQNDQPRNPLHGVTLETIVNALVAQYGWTGLAERVPLRCFSHEPSVVSSLKFLRRTAWARAKVENLYLATAVEVRVMPRADSRGLPPDSA